MKNDYPGKDNEDSVMKQQWLQRFRLACAQTSDDYGSI